jgi:hypothetical protein
LDVNRAPPGQSDQTESTGESIASRSWQQLRRRPMWRVALGLLMAVTVAAVASVPLVEAMASESAMAQTLAGSAGLTVEQRNVAGVEAFNAFVQKVGDRVNARMGSDLVQVTDFASGRPLSLVSVNSQSLPGPSGLQLVPTYVDHLADHAQVLAGELPPEGLGGQDVAVTMLQQGADQIGLRLSDRFCLGSTEGQPAVCARVVGLWRPLDPREPFWGGTVPGLQLMTTRYDFFKLAGPQPGPSLVAGLRYRPNPYLIGSARAADVSDRIGLLRRDLAADPNLRVGTDLGRTLDTFRERQQAVAAAIDLVVLAIGLLALATLALVTRRLLDSEARERGELLRQGWPRARIWGVSIVGLLVLAALAAAAGLSGGALVGAVLAASGSGLTAQWLRASDLGAITAPVGIGIGGIVLIPVGLAALAVTTSREAQPSAGRSEGGRLTRWHPSALARVLAVGGLLTLPRRLHGEISGTLARSQLEQRPQQHAGVASVLTLATAVGVVLAVELVTGLVSGGVAQPAPLHGGLEVSLLLGLLAALVAAVVGWGIHFRSTAEHRQEEYATLFANGLPPATIAESVHAEETVVLRTTLSAGVLLGVIILLGAVRQPPLTGMVLGLGALSAAGVIACIVLGTRAVGPMARRLPRGEAAVPAGEPPQ